MHREKSPCLSLAAIALLAAGLVGGCSSKADDAQLVTNIQSQMFADAQLKSANLQVAAIDGQVTLKGTVPNDAARYEAYKLATQTPGVKKVNDQMVIDQVMQASADVSPAAPADTPAPAISPAPASAPSVAPPLAKHVNLPKPHAAHHAKDNDAGDQYAQTSTSGNSALSAAAVQSSSMPSTDETPAPTAAPPVTPPLPAAPVPPPPPPPKQYVVSAGTTVSIRMIDSVDSSVNQPGEVFQASLDAPIVVGNDVVVPKGANVYVRLTSASSAGKMSGQSELRLELVKLEYQGGSFPLVSTTYSEQGKSRTKDTEKKVGGGAILGAIIGAVAGGGKGAAIGAAAGAGAGGVYQGATHGQQVKIPSETKLDFQLDQPATITVKPLSQPTSNSQPTPPNNSQPTN